MYSQGEQQAGRILSMIEPTAGILSPASLTWLAPLLASQRFWFFAPKKCNSSARLRPFWYWLHRSNGRPSHNVLDRSDWCGFFYFLYKSP